MARSRKRAAGAQQSARVTGASTPQRRPASSSASTPNGRVAEPQVTAPPAAGGSWHADLETAYLEEASRLRWLAARHLIPHDDLRGALDALARQSPFSAQLLVFWLLSDTPIDDRWHLWERLGERLPAFMVDRRSFPIGWVAQRYKEVADTLFKHTCAGTCRSWEFGEAARGLERAHPLSAMYLKGLMIEKLGGPSRYMELLSMTGRPAETRWMILHVVGSIEPADP